MYKYFISYNYAKNCLFGFGNCEIATDFKIKGSDEISKIAENIENEHHYPKGSVVILNFKLFE